MSVTEEQKAFLLRKLRTRYLRLDMNNDGYISREDYEIMGKKIVEHSKLSGQQAEATCKAFLQIADDTNLKPGVKIPREELAKRTTQAILSMTPDKRKSFVHNVHNVLFNCIDTNGDGHISLEEFKVYFHVIAPGTSEAEIAQSFNAIDADKNGEISREEFINAAEDFITGVEETELSKAFFGHLVD